jgi:hypothetical protein
MPSLRLNLRSGGVPQQSHKHFKRLLILVTIVIAAEGHGSISSRSGLARRRSLS